MLKEQTEELAIREKILVKMECLKIGELRKNKGDKYVNFSQVQHIYPERCQRELRPMYQILDRFDPALTNSLYYTRIAAETKMLG